MTATFELAAMTLGANGWKSFWFVTFPMIRLGVLAGGIFAFSFSFDEIIIALFLTNTQTMTLPKQLYSELRYNMTPTIAAASTIIITISLLLLTAVAVIESAPAAPGAPPAQEAKAEPRNLENAANASAAPASGRGARVVYDGVTKQYGGFQAVAPDHARDRIRRVLLDHRPERLGQDDPARRHRRLHPADRRGGSWSTAATSSASRPSSATSAWCSRTTPCSRI